MVAWIALLVEKVETIRHEVDMKRIEGGAKNDT